VLTESWTESVDATNLSEAGGGPQI